MKNIYLLGDSNASFLMMSIIKKDTRTGYASKEYNGFNIINIDDRGVSTSQANFMADKFKIIREADKSNSIIVLMYGTVDALLGINRSDTIETVVEKYVDKALEAFSGFDILFIEPVIQQDPEQLSGYFKKYMLNKIRHRDFKNVIDIHHGFWANLKRVCSEKGLRAPLEISPIIDMHGPFNRMSPEIDSEFFTPSPAMRTRFLHLNVSTSTAIADAITNTLK